MKGSKISSYRKSTDKIKKFRNPEITMEAYYQKYRDKYQKKQQKHLKAVFSEEARQDGAGNYYFYHKLWLS